MASILLHPHRPASPCQDRVKGGGGGLEGGASNLFIVRALPMASLYKPTEEPQPWECAREGEAECRKIMLCPLACGQGG